MSVADTLRAEQAVKLKRLSIEQRITLALELGLRDAALYAGTHEVTLLEARRRLAAQRQLGRMPSVGGGR